MKNGKKIIPVLPNTKNKFSSQKTTEKNWTDKTARVMQNIYSDKIQLVMSTFKEEKDEERHSSNKWQTNDKKTTLIH